MEVRSFWRPTTAALAALQAVGVSLERRSAPNAETFWGATLPEGFEIVRRGSPACASIIGVAGERACRLNDLGPADYRTPKARESGLFHVQQQLRMEKPV